MIWNYCRSHLFISRELAYKAEIALEKETCKIIKDDSGNIIEIDLSIDIERPMEETYELFRTFSEFVKTGCFIEYGTGYQRPWRVVFNEGSCYIDTPDSKWPYLPKKKILLIFEDGKIADIWHGFDDVEIEVYNITEPYKEQKSLHIEERACREGLTRNCVNVVTRGRKPNEI